MKTKAFYLSTFLLFLFAILTVGCSSTDINEEIGIEENNIIDEETNQIQSVDARDVKIPIAG